MIVLSALVGMDVFNDEGKQVGRVYDVVIDLQKGEIVRLALEPIRGAASEMARVFKEKSILYRNVKAVEKIVIVSSKPVMEEEPAVEPPKPLGYSSRYKR